MRAKLADFGLSRHVLTSFDCHTYCGTLLHMAPEVREIGDFEARAIVQRPLPVSEEEIFVAICEFSMKSNPLSEQ